MPHARAALDPLARHISTRKPSRDANNFGDTGRPAVPKRFRAKWTPVRVKKTRKCLNLELRF
jgi:hypothetical protein